MLIKKDIPIDNDPNGLTLSPGDIDGFCLCEIEGKGKVYIYYSEVKKLIKLLQKVKP